MTRWRAVACLCMLLPLFAHEALAQTTAPARRRSTNAELIKEALVAAASLLATSPDLRSRTEVTDRVIAIENVLLILDSYNDHASLDVLASLGSYYLGEGPGGTYSCLLVRKGKAIRNRLEALVKSGKNECKVRYRRLPEDVRHAACRDEDAYHGMLQAAIDAIDAGEKCDFQ